MDQSVRDYLMKKYGIGASNDEEMQQAQDLADQRRLSADLGSAANTIGAAIAGTKAENGFYDTMRQGADQSVKDVQVKRKNAMDNMALVQAGSKEMLADQERERDEDMSSNETRTYQALASRMLPKQDFSQMNASQIKRVLPSLEKLADIDAKKAASDEARKDRWAMLADRKEAQRMAVEERRAHEDTTRQDKKNELAKTASEKQRQSMFEVEDRRTNINQNLDILDKMIDEDGTFELFGSHNQDMDRLVEAIATDMAKLQDPQSVARPAEVEAVKKNLVAPGFGNRNATARDIIKNFKGEVERRAQNAYNIRGLETPQTKSTSTFPRQIRKGNQAATVANQAELDEALAEGWQ